LISDDTEGGNKMTRRVGLVGLGAMGRPIAEHLMEAGVPTRVFDLDARTVDRLVARGAEAASSLPELAAASDVLIVVVPSDDDVRDVCLGPGGLVSHARDGTVLVISASVRPDTCQEVARAAADVGVDVLDAALTGGVRGAEAGQINLLVGGEEPVLDGIRPVLEPWTAAIHHLGPLGAGQVGKTVNNLCHWAQVAIVHEALLLGQRLGVPPSKARAALLDGPARSGTLADIEKMRLTWWKKDIENAERMAETVEHPLPLTSRVYELMPGITVDGIAALVADRDPEA
jgi:3-hydroxyisobutyrate dehydrogenase-like beta-hydroxyacid dehydrogenase